MPVKSVITDGFGGKAAAGVSANHELLTRRYEYSSASSVTADVANTAYNLITPQAGYRIVITDIMLYANKNVGVGDATVVLYEATAADTTTVSTTIFTTEMLKQTRVDLTGLQLITSEGRWVNVKTDDDDVFATVMYYRIPTT